MNLTGKTEDVYGLIASMSTAEKSFFQKINNVQISKSLPLHLQLFELIANGKISDDTAAKNALNIKSSTQLSNLKNLLGKEVLDVISFSNRESSPETRYYFGLLEIEVAVARNNFNVAKRCYKRLWQEADALGQYHWCVDLLRWKKKFRETENTKKTSAEESEFDDETALYTSCQQTDIAVQNLSERLHFLKAETPLRFLPDQHNAVQEIMDALLQLQPSVITSGHLRLRYLAVACQASYMLQQFTECSAFTKEAKGIWLKSPELLQGNSQSFITISDTAFYNAFANNRINEAIRLLGIFNKLAANYADNDFIRKRWNIIAFNTQLKIAHKTGNYLEVKTLIYDKEQILKDAKEVCRPNDFMSILNSLAISLFVLDEFAEAESLILDIKELNRTLDREDILYFSLIFNLLILYELKAWYRLDTATDAAYHLLYSKKKLRPFEKEFMRFMKHLPAYRGKGTLEAAIRTFLEKLDTFRNDPVLRLHFLYFNYYDWLQSKLAGISYREYKRQLLANEG